LGNAALVSFGLRLRSYSVLALAAGGERPSQRELATFLSLDPSQVVALVDDLEKRELVERVADPRDRRANVVRATPEGSALAAEVASALTAVDAELFEGISDAEREMLTAMLSRIAFGVR
jgi:DNA-binding MarR family transcriptional regulator